MNSNDRANLIKRINTLEGLTLAKIILYSPQLV